MEWWDGLWLNEGFATSDHHTQTVVCCTASTLCTTRSSLPSLSPLLFRILRFMESFGVDFLFPEWRMWDQFVSSVVEDALSLDMLRSSHPIEATVSDAQDVDEIFDSISYAKGALVVRLLEDYIGHDAFRSGIRAYIHEFQYRNATTNDLWRHLSTASHQPIAEIAGTWTKQTGFPLLTVSEGKEDGEGGVTYEVTQRRFLESGVDEKDETLWTIPVSLICSGDKHPRSPTLIKQRTGQLTLKSTPGQQQHAWVKLNPYQTAPYRVHYPAAMLQQLRTAIQQGGDSAPAPADRLGLLNDLFALARAGLVKTTAVLDFIDSYRDETQYAVWTGLLDGLDEIAELLMGGAKTETSKLLSRFILRLIQPVMRRVGWDHRDDDDHLTQLLRARMLEAAVEYGDQPVEQEAKRRFDLYVQHQHQGGGAAGSSPLPADARSPAYCAAIRQGGAEAYHSLLRLHSGTDLQEEKVRCLHALAASTQEDLIQQSLSLAFSDQVRSQDAPSFISQLASSSTEGLHAVWHWLQQHWDDTVLRHYSGMMELEDFVRIVELFSDEQHQKEVEAFFHAHKTPGADQAREQAVEQLHSNVHYLQREGADIHDWLKQHVGDK